MLKSKDTGKVRGRSRRNVGKEREWRALLGEQRGSGESVRAFCRQRQLRETSFYRWRREIALRDREAAGKQQKKTSPPILAPVVFVDEPREAFSNSSSPSIEIVLGGVFNGGATVRVPPHSTREQLDMVLAVLEQRLC